jgi:PAS domain S-box-containing protein
VEALSNESRFKTIFQSVGDPVYIADPSGRIVAANEQAATETGYSLEELLRMRVADLAATDIAEAVAARFREVFARKSATFEVVHHGKDGTCFPVEINARAIEYDRGPAVLGVARNLSERKGMEEALRVSLEKYRVLVESFPLGISITDKDGAILETNRQAERLVGVPRREHEGRNLRSPP